MFKQNMSTVNVMKHMQTLDVILWI